MTDQEILTAIQFTVVEPPNGGASWPSGLWTRDEVTGSLTQRQDRFLKDSLILLAHTTRSVAPDDTPPTIPPPLQVVASQTRITLPSDCLRVVSVVWEGEDGSVRELVRTDSFETDHFLPDWEAVGAVVPLVFMEYETPTREIQIAPMPQFAGSLDLLYVPLGTPLTGNGVDFTLFDECVHGVKYGTLADLFGKEGQGHDAARAAYCEQRFQLAIDLARIILQGWA